MDHDVRSFQPVKVTQIGVEHGRSRFDEEGGNRPPAVSRWRNNLTALSQKHNLYFIASDSEITVYEPEFPFQLLRGKHALCIKVGLANKDAPGYLSSRREGISDHCINHIVLGELGTQEILLATTDSGNVVAYYTNSIREAILKEPYRFSDRAYSDVVGLRPFFSQWVHQSAWGLAIHKQARMIAVSANTPNEAQPPTRNDFSATITVYAFALSQRQRGNEGVYANSSDESDHSSDGPEWNDWIPLKDGTPPSRDRNYKILLSGFDGHDNNIPNISFVNASEDEEGAWLLSTDISGAMKLWQVWKQKCWRTWDFGNYDNARALWMNQSYPGWNVAALDLHSFRPAKTTGELIGFHRAPMYFGFNDRGDSYDITQKVRRHTPDASEYHPLHPIAQQDPELSDPEEFLAYLSDMDEEDESLRPVRSSEAALILTQDDHETAINDDQEHGMLLEAARVEPSDLDLDSDSEDNASSPMSINEEDEDASSLIEMGQETTAEGKNSKALPSIPKKNPSMPAIAILHCSDSHVRLLSGPQAKYPHIFCAHILRQILPNDINRSFAGLEFSHMDRLNMMQTIPELGLVLVATQTGRVAVCSLNRRADGFLSLRVDWILPTKKQERNGARPSLSVLIGMAVGPVQGQFETESQNGSDEEIIAWGQDNVQDDVPITFDPKVVNLRAFSPVLPESGQQKHSKSVSRKSHEPSMRQASWNKPVSIAPWKAVQNTRRFRLMLTYSDLSVLTYEISRDVEMRDIASSDL